MANRLIGGIEVIVSDDDRYLQINDISGSDLMEIWEQIKTDYALYEKWICYHNYTKIPFALLDDIGAVLLDDCIETHLIADSLICSDMSGVVRITEDNFDEFAAYHRKCNPDCGAQPERIRRNLSHWGIFALLTNNRITDYIILAMGNPEQAEVFCIQSADSAKCKALITCAAKYAFGTGKKDILYMADDNTIAYQAAISVGFTNTGFYKGYAITNSR